MKKVLLTVAVMMTMAQAESVVHYDKSAKEEAQLNETTLSKPNHPTTNSVVKYDTAKEK